MICVLWHGLVSLPATDHSVAAVSVPVLSGVDSGRHNDGRVTEEV